MRRRLLPALLCLPMLASLAACATTVDPPRQPVRTYVTPDQAYETWSKVLQRFVNERGEVDFAGLAQQREDLDRFVAWVYDVSPGNRPNYFPNRNAVLAYHLNAYNALAMYNVIDAGIPKKLNLLGRYNFFIRRKVRVGGVTQSLKAYEDDVIRALGEPRIHWALNCMAVSCPRLPRVPFDPARLDMQLNELSREFFNSSKHVRVDDENQIVRYPEIFDFFPEDFLRFQPTFTAYANQYRKEKVPASYTVKFIPYDWTINAQNRPGAAPPLHIQPDQNRY